MADPVIDPVVDPLILTNAEQVALDAMKRRCKILQTILSDAELLGFLNDHAKMGEYDISHSIYSAASSAITVIPEHFSRGGVVTIYHDLTEIIKQFRPPRRLIRIVRKY